MSAAPVQAPAPKPEQTPAEKIGAPRITPANTSNRRLKSIKRSVQVIVRICVTHYPCTVPQHMSHHRRRVQITAEHVRRPHCTCPRCLMHVSGQSTRLRLCSQYRPHLDLSTTSVSHGQSCIETLLYPRMHTDSNLRLKADPLRTEAATAGGARRQRLGAHQGATDGADARVPSPDRRHRRVQAAARRERGRGRAGPAAERPVG